MKKHQIPLTALAAFAVLLAAPSFAQEQSGSAEKIHSLDEIVVSATRTEKTLADVPADVSVITEEDLKRKNYVSVNEALETIPGVMSYSGTGISPGPPASAVVNLRSFHGAMRSMIMVNGQPSSPFMYAASLVHWSAIPVDSIERIEVVRGPFSALYGGDAVGGLVNIITKVPEAFEATVRAGYGSNSTYKVHADIADRPLEKLSLSAAYDFKQTDNYVSDFNVLTTSVPDAAQAATAVPVSGAVQQPNRTGGTVYEVGDKGSNEYAEHTFSLNGKVEPTESSSFKAGLLYSFYEVDPSGSSSYLRDAAGNEVRSGLVSFPANGTTTYLNVATGGFMAPRAEKASGVYTLEYSNDLSSALRIKASAGLTDFTEDKVVFPIGNATASDGPGVFQEAPSQIWTGEFQTDYAASSWLLLTGGLSLRRDEGQFNSYMLTNWQNFDSINLRLQTIDPESNRYGIYLQGEITPSEKLAIYLGGRYDWWDSEASSQTPAGTAHLTADDQSAFSPKISFVYTPYESTTLRLSGGKAFRVPNFFELYQPLRTAGATYLPNPNLEPEITWSWETGIEQAFAAGRTVLNLTYFEHYTTDFIDSRSYPDPNNPTVTIAQRDNFGEVEVRGLEVGIRQRFTTHLIGFANYTYTDAEITENQNYPDYVGNRPMLFPESLIFAVQQTEIGRGMQHCLTPFRHRIPHVPAHAHPM
ncbi:MAG: TonB-dependent receptor, partial [Candidatus Electrothrix sp. AX1]|nr:TonB-dependent receptor [Candidatus Electrothrix sp. AX1]